MPIYEFECCECGNQIQVLQKFTDKPVTECSVCRGRMKKLISQSTFHLKGSGWYVTDYASKSGGAQAKTATTEEKSTTAETKTTTTTTTESAKTTTTP